QRAEREAQSAEREAQIRLPSNGWRSEFYAVRDSWLRARRRSGIVGVMSDVTQILSAIEEGDPHAAGQARELLHVASGNVRKRIAGLALTAVGPAGTVAVWRTRSGGCHNSQG